MTVAPIRADSAEQNEMPNDKDLTQIWQWNAHVPATINECVHDLISSWAQCSPGASAVCAWDGELTYAELLELSTILAYRLIKAGVRRGTIVPLCFEKSVWMPVAILGVMMAGGAMLALETSLPISRLESIVNQVPITTILSSELQQDLAHQLSNIQPIVVSQQSLNQLRKMGSEVSLPKVSSQDLLYVIFTSGSTGVPKGVLITHSNYASSIHHQQESFRFSPASRVYDFASYAFDVTWINSLTTLSSGGCMCIPNAMERLGNLQSSINNFKANHLDITTTIMRVIDPAKCPCVQSVMQGGEKLEWSDVEAWKSVRVCNSYGPTECTVTSTVEALSPTVAQGASPPIGKGKGLVTWIVNPEHSDRLVPVGEEGELWLEGPLVGQGYLNDPVKTKAFFVTSPSWLAKGGPGYPGRQGRLYRTGDLVRYNKYGSLEFLGRIDDQIKINGQRVELGDIEHHVLQNLSYHTLEGIPHTGTAQVAVIRVQTPDSKLPELVAFVAPTSNVKPSQDELDRAVSAMTAGLFERLTSILPKYMVPVKYIALAEMPLSPSFKLDRRRLRELASAVSLVDVDTCLNEEQRREVTTSAEIELRQLWSSVIGVKEDAICGDDHFIRIGGDSVLAIRLVAAARNKGLLLPIQDVLKWPVLHKQALCLRPLESKHLPLAHSERLTVSSPEVDRELVLKHVLPQLGESPALIGDVLPATPMQEHFLGGASRSGHFGIRHLSCELPSSVDTGALTRACQGLVQHLEILRTIFVKSNGRFYQVVLPQLTVPFETYEVSSYSAFDDQVLSGNKQQATARLGHPFACFTLIKVLGGISKLYVRLSHTQYDGICLPRIFEVLGSLYNHTKLPEEPSISHLVQQLLSQTDLSYWNKLLDGSSMSKLPFSSITTSKKDPESTVQLSKIFKTPANTKRSRSTPASVFILACAMVIAEVTNSADVLFGYVNAGRAGLDEEFRDAVFPCVTVLPIRVRIGHGRDVADLEAQVQNQLIDSVSYQTTNAQRLRSHCPSWPKDASDFGFICHYQNLDKAITLDICGTLIPVKHSAVRDPSPDVSDVVVLRATPMKENRFQVGISSNSAICGEEQADQLIDQLHAHWKRLQSVAAAIQ